MVLTASAPRSVSSFWVDSPDPWSPWPPWHPRSPWPPWSDTPEGWDAPEAKSAEVDGSTGAEVEEATKVARVALFLLEAGRL